MKVFVFVLLVLGFIAFLLVGALMVVLFAAKYGEKEQSKNETK